VKAMILAAGLGTRLGKITDATPKCLVNIGGKTLLEAVVENLQRAGVQEIVINLHHLAAQVQTFVEQRKNFGLRIHFSHEPQILGTGGGLKQARQWLGEENFFVHNADIYSTVNLQALRTAHEKSGAIATLAVMKRETDRALVFTQHGNLVGWDNAKENKSDLLGQGERFGFSGIQIVSPKLFEFMEQEQGSFSIIRPYMKAARAGLDIKAFEMTDAYWIDAGTPERLEKLRSDIATKRL
jgi:MurNAc alpha-1-phosphate uridylyltransferase